MKNFLIRLITSIFIVVVVVGTFFLRELVDTRFMYILIYTFSLFGTLEMVRALSGKLTAFYKCVAIAFAITLTPMLVFFGTRAAAIVCFSAAFLIIVSTVFDFEKFTVENLGCGLLALFYPTGLLIPMLLANGLEKHSFIAMVLIFAVSPAADAAAYVVGSLLKGPKLCEKVSPKKTVSGAIGGLLGGVGAAMLAWLVFSKGEISSNVTAEIVLFSVVGLLSACATILGDLVEGAIKRKLGIKDMGKLLPGHGGMLDRIDGIMLGAACVYLVFAFLG